MFSPVPPAGRRCRVLYVSPLKALAVDVERNLRAPFVGIAARAQATGAAFASPTIAIRTGDTPQAERARFQRAPADILITTPESLYLLLTSNAREALRSIETVIIDEIHALVPSKRGAHLALSLERLQAITAAPLQRIGLSATQRPLDEVARYLGGVAASSSALPVSSTKRRAGSKARKGPTARSKASAALVAAEAAPQSVHDEFADTRRGIKYRPVTIVDAGQRKPLKLSIEVPVEDMARIGTPVELASGPTSAAPRSSIWSAIHPRLVELIRSHRSTLIFVNSRRLAERLAGAINELAGETLALAHHGSVAREQRNEIEDRLKAGTLPALAATSSLELGIDMGAIDLVIQIEAPPSVASGLQRIGRAGHQVGAASEGIIFPKFRGDLLACAAVARAMFDGRVEATRYPRNPLDVLAQQIVAMVAVEPWDVDALFALARSAAPFESLSRGAFEGVIDMLSGRYPSDDFAELRPRLTWDRTGGTLQTRVGAKRLAIANAGTIPDRGLYGVFLVGSGRHNVRVGELDEEMVFETHVGDVFVLGASSWRIEEITHDRVFVSPAAGAPGKMPFWKGDRPSRPLELGLEIGALTRDLARTPVPAAVGRLVRDHALDQAAAENLVRYVRDQAETGAVPDAETVVIERVRDELGDWRVCLLSPRGGRLHAPWCMAAVAKIRRETGVDVETMWTDDGFVVRFPDVDQPPDPALLIPDPEEVEGLILRELGSTALFAARFRENASRSLLLPRRRAGARAPLWQQRKKAADLLAVAARYGSFPIILETYRECLRDIFDVPALVETLRDLRSGKIRLAVVNSDTASPFASSLLFGYVANFLYDGDAPLAERRAQALAVDHVQLRELIGDAELRDLLDADDMDALEHQLQRLDPDRRAKSDDGVHDLLLELGDLTAAEIAARVAPSAPAGALTRLAKARRVVEVRLQGEGRYIAVEDVARYRDALGTPVPMGIPAALLTPVPEAAQDLVSRFARTHTPFEVGAVERRLGLAPAQVQVALLALRARGRVVEGAFRPGGTHTEWCDAGVLRALRRRSLARLRREVEPVEAAAFARFLIGWHGVGGRRSGADALLDVIEQLQGAPIPISVLETEVLPARLAGYQPEWLDTLAAAGEVAWVGFEPVGHRDGRIGLFLTDHLRTLRPEPAVAPTDGREADILRTLAARGASFFGDVHEAAGGGYPGETVEALWRLVWAGLITNDTFHALRAFARPPARRGRDQSAPSFRSRRVVPRQAEGRWALVQGAARPRSATEQVAARARQLLARHGVLIREACATEAWAGGFSAVYPALKAMEEAGRARRGYFVAGRGATQFAQPGALDLLRSFRQPPIDAATAAELSAVDPANPYGASLPWPVPGLARVAGASVVLVDGALAAYVTRGGRELRVFLPEDDPARSRAGRAVAARLGARAGTITEVNGEPVLETSMAPFLVEAGFVRMGPGLQRPVIKM